MTQLVENSDSCAAYGVDRCAGDLLWDSFVATHRSAHFLQTSRWALLKSRFGWGKSRVMLKDNRGEIVAGASILFRRVAGLTLAYIPRGPLTDWEDRVLTQALFDEVAAECRRQGASVLKIEPDLLDSYGNRARISGYGFLPSTQTVQPRSTIVMDIGGDEPEILRSMKGKWRYNVRLAGRKDVTVREMGVADLDAFHRLMDATGQRDGFAVHSPDYYTVAHELLVPKDGVYLLAEYEGRPLASIVVLLAGKTAWYVWGASNNEERNRMPNHALQWAGILWARAHGATTYDLWGIPDELGVLASGMRNGEGGSVHALQLPINLEALPAHDLWGVYRFKQGFGGNVVRYVGAWDLPIHAMGHRVYQVGLSARQRRQDVMRRVHQIRQQTHFTAQAALPKSLRRVSRRDEWQSTLAELPAAHVLQSWEWGEVKSQTGWVAERIVIDQDGQKGSAGFQFLWRQPLSNIPLRIGYIPKGPLAEWTDRGKIDHVLDRIEAYARAQRCIFVKIDPDVREESHEGRMLLAALKRRGWRFSGEQIQFKNTAYTDLRVGEEALLAAMKSKWRYNIRLSQRRGIGVRRGGEDDLRAFYDLYEQTGRRDGFIVRPYAYYETAWRVFLTAGRQAGNPTGGALLLAEHEEDNTPAAGLFLLRYQDRAWYFYGASSEHRRRDMPNYLLQWEAMRWAIGQGCSVYDWWGAPTHLHDGEDPMQGVWQFKQGFGAHFQHHVGAWDYPVFPLAYGLYCEIMPRAIGLARRVS